MELAVVEFDLKIWRHHLYGKTCEVYTSQEFEPSIQSEEPQHEIKELETISDYRCEIKYHHGKGNTVVDVLS